MKKIMALDIGRIRIGIATSDILQMYANPFEVYKTCGRDSDTDYIATLSKKIDVECIVVGLPLMLDGTDSKQTTLVRIFADLLQTKVSVPVILHDERLTSVQAEDILLEANLSREERKKVIDKVAATIILQDYLDNKKRSNNNE